MAIVICIGKMVSKRAARVHGPGNLCAILNSRYPLRCGQECTGPCTFKRTWPANHIIQILDSRRLIRCNFAVHMIT